MQLCYHPQGRIQGGGGGGVLGVRTAPPPFGGPLNFIKRGKKTSQKGRVLELKDRQQ